MQLKRFKLSGKAGGFTIVELMIATAIFGVIMLIIAVGVVRFTHDYYKGVVSANTQATTRSIMSQITQSLQFGTSFSATDSTTTPGSAGFCMGSVEFSYAEGQEITPTGSLGAHQTRHGLLQRSGISACSSAVKTDDVLGTVALAASQRELLAPHMRISAFDITQLSGNVYRVHLRVIYGDDDLLSPKVTPGTTDFSNENCSGVIGSQWCAVSDLTTTVDKRL